MFFSKLLVWDQWMLLWKIQSSILGFYCILLTIFFPEIPLGPTTPPFRVSIHFKIPKKRFFFQPVIFTNVVDGMKTLLTAMKDLAVAFEDKQLEPIKDQFFEEIESKSGWLAGFKYTLHFSKICKAFRNYSIKDVNGNL